MSIFSCGRWWVFVTPNGILLLLNTPPTRSSDGVGVMYHGQLMAPFLALKRINARIQSKLEAPCGKLNKERGNDHILPVSWMLWNSLEDSREFYSAGDGYISWSRPRVLISAGREEQFLAQKSVFLVGIFPLNSKGGNR